ncbi:phosphotransferase family protein [Bacillus xiapuensis]|uniref:phosphotransferase family protein n=1 Tax=Bacillus xiapuensis TaxID=2014075 RepID=UPI000C238211|nr:phosphotransferase family protein [Bacillus xiapuensis]
MEHIFGREWEITPAGGVTGKAYFARNGGQQLFLKKNSSPFLAVLSAEGIVPKLIWTKRLENGDVISAQHWLDGRELKPHEMAKPRVAKLMCKIHSSQPLLSMLEKLGKKPSSPEMIMSALANRLDEEVSGCSEVQSALRFLKSRIGEVTHGDYVVCHGDVNHNNWLLSADNQLYLIDWDGAMIGDPAIDLGMLLYKYVEKDEWQAWLSQYGLTYTPHLELRMKWYVLAQILLAIQWDKEEKRLSEMRAGLADIRAILEGSSPAC